MMWRMMNQAQLAVKNATSLCSKNISTLLSAPSDLKTLRHLWFCDHFDKKKIVDCITKYINSKTLTTKLNKKLNLFVFKYLKKPHFLPRFGSGLTSISGGMSIEPE